MYENDEDHGLGIRTITQTWFRNTYNYTNMVYEYVQLHKHGLEILTIIHTWFRNTYNYTNMV